MLRKLRRELSRGYYFSFVGDAGSRGEVVNAAGSLTTMSSTKQPSSNGTNHHHIVGFSGRRLRYAISPTIHPLYDTMMISYRAA
jgi:hypothetical protein